MSEPPAFEFLSEFRSDQHRANRISFLRTGIPDFFGKWHWFKYHFSRVPPTPFGQSLVDACIGLESVHTGCGREFLREIARIGGRERNWQDYDQILQKLAEVLIANAVLAIRWPTTPSIQIEETAPGSLKSVDCTVTMSDCKYGFEIKAPALLMHSEARATNDLQLTGRTMPRDHLDLFAGGSIGGVTLPRDNPVYDFLVSANSKFAGFKEELDSFTGILVIVWDDFIYEPISILLHEKCGLLTEHSYKRVDNRAEVYPFIDAIILVRHLTYFKTAVAELALPDGRHHAFHIGGDGALPNVVIPMSNEIEIPRYILDGLGAWPFNDPWLQSAGDYLPQDFVWWLPPES